ncbi:hypothetical protein TEA_023594 [Camellia sinensis var. sinensis]|uniref:Secreted protein n=1 Tax=Camellia sinensis var. sinensis TaxID=542762 RepID=A0A4S4EYJ3_CAMSN|nr:hypothetical protein TEA_023594 [Camellia sinensis var. sinensis]
MANGYVLVFMGALILVHASARTVPSTKTTSVNDKQTNTVNVPNATAAKGKGAKDKNSGVIFAGVVESPTSSHTEHDDCISIVGVGPITFPQKSGEEKADDVAMAHGDRRLTQCNSGEQSDTVVEQDDTVVEETF